MWWPAGKTCVPFFLLPYRRSNVTDSLLLTLKAGQLGPQPQGSPDRGRREQSQQPLGVQAGHLPEEHEARQRQGHFLSVSSFQGPCRSRRHCSGCSCSRWWLFHQLHGMLLHFNVFFTYLQLRERNIPNEMPLGLLTIDWMCRCTLGHRHLITMTSRPRAGLPRSCSP